MEARKIGSEMRIATSHCLVMKVGFIPVENKCADIKLAWHLP